MIKTIQLNKEYKTGHLVRYTDWHAGHYTHTIEEHVIKFLDEKHLTWYQNIILDAGGGSHVQRFEGQYTIDRRWAMIKADLICAEDKKILNGSFSINPNTIILDIQSFRGGVLLENKPFCFALSEI